MAPPTGDTLYSPANDRRFEHWVWTPPGDGPFPVVLLLHGVYDAGSVWWRQGRAHETMARLVAGDEIEPAIVVMASDTGAGLGSGYCDWADGTTAVETYLIDELLPHVTDTLPASGRLHVTGLSMGGYGSFLLALRHPGLFASATSTSGFFGPDRLFRFVPDASTRMWGDEAGKQAHDVTQLVLEPHRTQGLRLAFDCGTEDDLITENRALHDRLHGAGIAHGYAEHPGGHEWEYWSTHLEDHLRFHLGCGGPLAGS